MVVSKKRVSPKCTIKSVVFIMAKIEIEVYEHMDNIREKLQYGDKEQ